MSNITNWTRLPEKEGQQFVLYNNVRWVSSVQIEGTTSVRGNRITVWQGSSYYTLWSKIPHDFLFHEIVYPDKPTK